MLGFSLISIYFKPNDKDLISLFGLLYPYIYLLAFIVIPLAYRGRKIVFFLGLGLLVFGLPQILKYVRPKVPKQKPKSDITALSFNTMMGFGLVDGTKEVSKERLEELRRLLSLSPRPDVLCLQEAGPLALKAFDLLEEYPYRHRKKPKGAVVYSKHPIVKKGVLEFGSKINSCLWADVVIHPGDTVRVYSTHLESTRLSSSSYELLAEDDNTVPRPISGIKDLMLKYPRYAGKRAEQAKRVKSHISQSPHPVILCGDMNEPPTSYTYRLLKNNMTDAFVENGGGFGNTWKGKIPMLRIDYIFASKGLTNTSYTCISSDLSDHYPIKASYTIKQ